MKGAFFFQCFATGMCVCIDTDICTQIHKYIFGWSLLRIYFCVLSKFTLEPQIFNLLQYLMMQEGGTTRKMFNITRLTLTLK